ncbi:MAG TPA: putative O-glycosylation ligase, exosortase A system-associated [Rhizomicrobium sp.]|nr:putative O-glycosylation ligase, exosortase A system-associated [Rhizomicrobium sp.]
MRDIALVIITAIGLVWTVRMPFVGVLLWAWITLMNPHQLAFGFSQTFQINLLVAVVTMAAWAFSKERKLPPMDATTAVFVLFFLWITFNSFFCIVPIATWPMWNRTWRLMLFGGVVAVAATNRVRIHALIAMWALSLCFYGVKGGGFTLLTGGGNHVEGPPNSTISDNNQLALAILMALPLANYLRVNSANVLVRRALLAAIILSVVAVLGSYSRGAFIALAGLLVLAFFRARRKWLFPLAAAIIVVPAVLFMPAGFFDRVNSIQNAGQDASFQGRVDAWHVAYGFASDHFPLGAGFDGPQQAEIFRVYAPGKVSHAAHSIYFQVLGDNGFVGLGLYLLLLALCFYNSVSIRRMTKGRPEFSWAFELAGMLQLTMFVFCLGGAALSFAYYDGVFIIAGLLSAMRQQIGQATATGWRKKTLDKKVSRDPQPLIEAEV